MKVVNFIFSILGKIFNKDKKIEINKKVLKQKNCKFSYNNIQIGEVNNNGRK